MQLDDEILTVGADVYHMLHGAGRVKSIAQDYATTVFGVTELIISDATIMKGDIKMIGLAKPLVFWQTNRHNRDVSAYLPIIRQLETL